MIELAIEQRRPSLGGGFEVGRVLPFSKLRMVGPFIFFACRDIAGTEQVFRDACDL